MPDIVDSATRSRMMSGIKGKNTKPELLVRKALYARGFRYRLHSKKVPGKPDIVLSKYRAAVFIHGCFWHGHDCSLFRLPGTRREFWEIKIERNKERDKTVANELSQAGWRRLVIWECSFRGMGQIGLDETIRLTEEWLLSDSCDLEIRGDK